jgi:hypothetical protein
MAGAPCASVKTIQVNGWGVFRTLHPFTGVETMIRPGGLRNKRVGGFAALTIGTASCGFFLGLRLLF